MVDHNFKTFIKDITPLFKYVIDLSGIYEKKNVKKGPLTHSISHKKHIATTTLKEIKSTKHAHNPNPLTRTITKLGKRSGTHQGKGE